MATTVSREAREVWVAKRGEGWIERKGAENKARSLAADLKLKLEGEVRFDDASRAMWATAGGNYRQVPIGVVIPRSIDDVVHTIDVCRRYEAPILSRGGGTSLAGQCANVAVVIDFSKYLTNIVSLDPDRRVAVVEPG